MFHGYKPIHSLYYLTCIQSIFVTTPLHSKTNSGIPVSFSGLRRDRKWPVPDGGTETGRSPEKSGSREMAFGNADLYHLGHQCLNILVY